MRPPENFTRIINRKRYSTKTATLIAGNDYWDGHNFERRGANLFLYKTPRGNFFTVFLTQWQGAKDRLEPIGEDYAIELYETVLSEHYTSYEKAFPFVTVEEA